MSQYRLETEEDMSSYLDINFGHGVTAVFTNSSGSASTINIIINNETKKVTIWRDSVSIPVKKK